MSPMSTLVIPAKAGIQIESFCFSLLSDSCAPQTRRGWIQAFAGMTKIENGVILHD